MKTEHFPGIFRRIYDPPLQCLVGRRQRNIRLVSAEEMDGISEVWFGFSDSDGDASVALFPVGIVYVDWEEPV